MFREARQNRVFEDVVHQIQEAILEGRLEAGDRLPSERDLVDMFKTSRGTLREALRVLEQKGLIEIRLGVSGGGFVKGASADSMSESLGLLLRSQKVTLDQLAEFRQGVEGHVAALAARRFHPRDLQKLEALLSEAARHCRDVEAHRDDFIRTDEKIHMTLAQITGNPLYIYILQTIHDNIHRYYEKYLSMDASEIRENHRDLQAIVDAVRRGDAEKARLLAEDHVGRFNLYMKRREQGLTDV